jgi:hypothetical protein
MQDGQTGSFEYPCFCGDISVSVECTTDLDTKICDASNPQAPVCTPVMCNCNNPGVLDSNTFTCNDGTAGSCSEQDTCAIDTAFQKSDMATACQPVPETPAPTLNPNLTNAWESWNDGRFNVEDLTFIMRPACPVPDDVYNTTDNTTDDTTGNMTPEAAFCEKLEEYINETNETLSINQIGQPSSAGNMFFDNTSCAAESQHVLMKYSNTGYVECVNACKKTPGCTHVTSSATCAVMAYDCVLLTGTCSQVPDNCTNLWVNRQPKWKTWGLSTASAMCDTWTEIQMLRDYNTSFGLASEGYTLQSYSCATQSGNPTMTGNKLAIMETCNKNDACIGINYYPSNSQYILISSSCTQTNNGATYWSKDASYVHWASKCWASHLGASLSGYTTAYGESCFDLEQAIELCIATRDCGGITSSVLQCEANQWTLRAGHEAVSDSSLSGDAITQLMSLVINRSNTECMIMQDAYEDVLFFGPNKLVKGFTKMTNGQGNGDCPNGQQVEKLTYNGNSDITATWPADGQKTTFADQCVQLGDACAGFRYDKSTGQGILVFDGCTSTTQTVGDKTTTVYDTTPTSQTGYTFYLKEDTQTYCSCDNPWTGPTGEYICSDGTRPSCSTYQFCTGTSIWEKGETSECNDVCQCTASGQSASRRRGYYNNQMKCTGTDGNYDYSYCPAITIPCNNPGDQNGWCLQSEVNSCLCGQRRLEAANSTLQEAAGLRGSLLHMPTPAPALLDDVETTGNAHVRRLLEFQTKHGSCWSKNPGMMLNGATKEFPPTPGLGPMCFNKTQAMHLCASVPDCGGIMYQGDQCATRDAWTLSNSSTPVPNPSYQEGASFLQAFAMVFDRATPACMEAFGRSNFWTVWPRIANDPKKAAIAYFAHSASSCGVLCSKHSSCKGFQFNATNPSDPKSPGHCQLFKSKCAAKVLGVVGADQYARMEQSMESDANVWSYPQTNVALVPCEKTQRGWFWCKVLVPGLNSQLFSNNNPVTPGQEFCTWMAGSADVLCEVAGLGPEDPFADLCVGIMQWKINKICMHYMQKVGTYLKSQFTSDMGCGGYTVPMVSQISAAWRGNTEVIPPMVAAGQSGIMWYNGDGAWNIMQNSWGGVITLDVLWSDVATRPPNIVAGLANGEVWLFNYTDGTDGSTPMAGLKELDLSNLSSNWVMIGNDFAKKDDQNKKDAAGGYAISGMTVNWTAVKNKATTVPMVAVALNTTRVASSSAPSAEDISSAWEFTDTADIIPDALGSPPAGTPGTWMSVFEASWTSCSDTPSYVWGTEAGYAGMTICGSVVFQQKPFGHVEKKRIVATQLSVQWGPYERGQCPYPSAIWTFGESEVWFFNGCNKPETCSETNMYQCLVQIAPGSMKDDGQGLTQMAVNWDGCIGTQSDSFNEVLAGGPQCLEIVLSFLSSAIWYLPKGVTEPTKQENWIELRSKAKKAPVSQLSVNFQTGCNGPAMVVGLESGAVAYYDPCGYGGTGNWYSESDANGYCISRMNVYSNDPQSKPSGILTTTSGYAVFIDGATESGVRIHQAHTTTTSPPTPAPPCPPGTLVNIPGQPYCHTENAMNKESTADGIVNPNGS